MNKSDIPLSLLCLALMAATTVVAVKLSDTKEELYSARREADLWKEDAKINALAFDSSKELVAALKVQNQALIGFHQAEMNRERFYRDYLVDLKVKEKLAAKKGGLHLSAE